MPTLAWHFRSRAEQTKALGKSMEEAHPEEPHWYLMVIGCDPTVRGKGFGQALMRSRLDRCDGEHAPAYLEASKAELVPYYRRFGFDQIGEIRDSRRPEYVGRCGGRPGRQSLPASKNITCADFELAAGHGPSL